MRFLADENIPRCAVGSLRAAGFDVRTIRELAPGAADRRIARLALDEMRTVITFDKDFGELAVREGAPAGVILLRLVPQAPDEVAELLFDVVRRVGAFADRLVVAERERVRIRRLRPRRDER